MSKAKILALFGFLGCAGVSCAAFGVTIASSVAKPEVSAQARTTLAVASNSSMVALLEQWPKRREELRHLVPRDVP